ncbi:MAG: ABC transporter permease [bacterium]|jgi:ABC-2 type transport system permease protein
MNNIWAIYKREMRTYFTSPLAYVLYVLFFIITGVFFYMYFSTYVMWSTRIMMQSQFGAPQLPNYTETVLLGNAGVISFILLFVVPMLTMRIFAEEKKMGTIELLFTYPVKDIEILLGKFFAAFTVILGMILPTLLYMLLSERIAPDQTYFPTVLASYVGIIAIATAFLSLGMLASAITENQIIAGLTAFAALLVLWMVGFVNEIQPGTLVGRIANEISVYAHFEEFSKGVINTGHLAYYILFTLFFLFFTLRVLEAHRWRG